MIILRGYKVLYDAAKNPVLHGRKTIAKWKIDAAEELGFNILSPVEWKKFLEDYTLSNGKKLPRYSEAGDVIVYMVFSWGMLPKRYEGVVKNRKAMNFFPGYNKAGEKRKTEIYGRLNE